MQRTTQRLKASLAIIRPNSNSLSSADFSDTRWADETIGPVSRFMCHPPWRLGRAVVLRRGSWFSAVYRRADDAAQKPDWGRKVVPGGHDSRQAHAPVDPKLLRRPVSRHLPAGIASRAFVFCHPIVISAKRERQAVRGGSPHAWPACSDLA